VADRIILAENASQVAVGEEDRSATASAGYGRLFAVMEIKTCDARLRPRATHPRLARKPIRSALARAQRAFPKNLARRLDPLSQQAASICFDIHRLAHTPNIVPNPALGFHTRALADIPARFI